MAHRHLWQRGRQRQLDGLAEGDKAVLASGLYRVAGHRQKLRVYWPVGVVPPG